MVPPVKTHTDPTPVKPVLIKSSSLSVSTLAVLHIACWASNIVLGIVAIWIRLQYSEGWLSSFHGIVGLSVWASTPFAVCGILSIASTKTTSRRLITWYMLSSSISLLFSIVILIYSILAIVREASLETYPKRLIVASITSFVCFAEIVTSTISFIVCFNAIGWNLKFTSQSKHKKFNGGIRTSRVGPSGEIEPGHVTVMALPPRQAAELFLSMYRPFLTHNPAFAQPGLEGYQTGETVNHFPDASVGEYRRHSSPDDRRRHRKRHHRRPHSRNDSPEDSVLGFPPDIPDDADELDNDWDTANMIRHPRIGIDPSYNRLNEESTQPPSRAFSQSRLATVHEDDPETNSQNDDPTTSAEVKVEKETKQNNRQNE